MMLRRQPWLTYSQRHPTGGATVFDEQERQAQDQEDQEPQAQAQEEIDERESNALAEDLEPSDEEAEQVTGGHPGHRRRRRRSSSHH